MLPKTVPDALSADHSEVSEIRSVSEIREALEPAAADPDEVAMLGIVEPAYSVIDPLEGDSFSSSSRRRSEYPCAFDAIAFVEGPRILTITWLPPAA